jgi:site-specific recombinase XerD
MNQFAPISVPALQLPALIAVDDDNARVRFLEFFAACIRNPNTRRAYSRAVREFLAWCESGGVETLAAIAPLHVAAFIEAQTKRPDLATPSVKQQLAAIRHLFDWLVVGQVVPFNPAASVRGPKHSVRVGKTPVLDSTEARELIDSIDVSRPVGLRDRALIALMAYSFARVGAALEMKVGDVFVQRRRLWVRLHEKGGKDHDMPCHHNLEEYLLAYIDGCCLRADLKGPLFRTIPNRNGELTRNTMTQSDAYRVIRRRALAAGIATKIGNHSFRATGITTYLKNGGVLEKAATMANHASTRTTQLYDRRSADVNLDEVERVAI